MKYFKVPEDKFLKLVNTLGRLDLLISNYAVFLDMTELEKAEEITRKLKTIIRKDFYTNLSVGEIDGLSEFDVVRTADGRIGTVRFVYMNRVHVKFDDESDLIPFDESQLTAVEIV